VAFEAAARYCACVGSVMPCSARIASARIVTRTDSSSTPSAFVLSNRSRRRDIAVGAVGARAGAAGAPRLEGALRGGVEERLDAVDAVLERLGAQRVLRDRGDLAVADGVGEERVDLLLVALLLDRLDALLRVGSLAACVFRSASSSAFTTIASPFTASAFVLQRLHGGQ
jgi:hypothetical protein